MRKITGERLEQSTKAMTDRNTHTHTHTCSTHKHARTHFKYKRGGRKQETGETNQGGADKKVGGHTRTGSRVTQTINASFRPG